jgi:hypothetical protein
MCALAHVLVEATNNATGCSTLPASRQEGGCCGNAASAAPENDLKRLGLMMRTGSSKTMPMYGLAGVPMYGLAGVPIMKEHHKQQQGAPRDYSNSKLHAACRSLFNQGERDSKQRPL